MTDSQSTEHYTPNAEIHGSPNVVPKGSGDEGVSSNQPPLIVTPPPHPKPFGVAEFTPPKLSFPDMAEDTSTSGTSPGFLQVSDAGEGHESYEEEDETDDESYTFSSHDGDRSRDDNGQTSNPCEDLSYLWQCPHCGRRSSQNCCLACMVEDAVLPDDFADVAASTNDNETSDSYSCETDQSDREPSNEN